MLLPEDDQELCDDNRWISEENRPAGRVHPTGIALAGTTIEDNRRQNRAGTYKLKRLPPAGMVPQLTGARQGETVEVITGLYRSGA